jgi:hypothetical protein
VVGCNGGRGFDPDGWWESATKIVVWDNNNTVGVDAVREFERLCDTIRKGVIIATQERVVNGGRRHADEPPGGNDHPQLSQRGG